MDILSPGAPATFGHNLESHHNNEGTEGADASVHV